MEIAVNRQIIEDMKKIFIVIFIAVTMVSCYDDYVNDFDYSSVYFPQQTNVRTIVVGEGMKFKVGAVLGGVIENNKNLNIDFILDDSLITPEILTAMKGGAAYVKAAVSSVTTLNPLPTDYYTLSNSSQIIIPKGDHTGTITVQIDSAKFLADTKTLKANYVLPFYISQSDADTILENKRTAVIGVRYDNMLFGNYWHGGVRTIKNAAGEIVSDSKYYTFIPAPEIKVNILTTVAPYTLETNRLSDQAGKMLLTLNIDGTITVSKSSSSTIEVIPDGESRFNKAKLLQDRRIYLSYKYENSDGTTSYVKDTLTFRNRIRDGINEWQDENRSNYK